MPCLHDEGMFTTHDEFTTFSSLGDLAAEYTGLGAFCEIWAFLPRQSGTVLRTTPVSRVDGDDKYVACMNDKVAAGPASLSLSARTEGATGSRSTQFVIEDAQLAGTNRRIALYCFFIRY